MDKLKGKMAMMIVDLSRKKLYMKDCVEILKSWKDPLFIGKAHLGTRMKVRIRPLDRPGVEADIDFADIFVRE